MIQFIGCKQQSKHGFAPFQVLIMLHDSVDFKTSSCKHYNNTSPFAMWPNGLNTSTLMAVENRLAYKCF